MSVELLPGFAALTGQDIERVPWRPFGGMPHVHVRYLFTTPDTVAGLMRLDAGAHEARHLHVGGQHHVWVVDGTVRFDGRHLDPGSYVHVPAGMTHTMKADADGCTLFFVFSRGS